MHEAEGKGVDLRSNVAPAVEDHQMARHNLSPSSKASIRHISIYPLVTCFNIKPRSRKRRPRPGDVLRGAVSAHRGRLFVCYDLWWWENWIKVVYLITHISGSNNAASSIEIKPDRKKGAKSGTSVRLCKRTSYYDAGVQEPATAFVSTEYGIRSKEGGHIGMDACTCR